MDTESPKDVNGNMNKPMASLEASKVEGHANSEDDSDSKSLLPPRIGGMSRKSDNSKTHRKKVQWNDKNGKKLVEVLEYEPSDSENEDDDSCICTIM
ncbi:PREDICTED: uncharacterized protein LOC109346150 isoform X2 [Lupinus angustifolius]|uniref:uncharacterized protein LOC109346150 isoform X2 n=1 Tax=Lupinus angustifolius TaxID=3871 RepID=UPI00092E9C3E|nr:PREDICTED: uncharacterized protein LOC109346150 isoform X2 [Lupinus angustifolius]